MKTQLSNKDKNRIIEVLPFEYKENYTRLSMWMLLDKITGKWVKYFKMWRHDYSHIIELPYNEKTILLVYNKEDTFNETYTEEAITKYYINYDSNRHIIYYTGGHYDIDDEENNENACQQRKRRLYD